MRGKGLFLWFGITHDIIDGDLAGIAGEAAIFFTFEQFNDAAGERLRDLGTGRDRGGTVIAIPLSLGVAEAERVRGAGHAPVGRSYPIQAAASLRVHHRRVGWRTHYKKVHRCLACIITITVVLMKEVRCGLEHGHFRGAALDLIDGRLDGIEAAVAVAGCRCFRYMIENLTRRRGELVREPITIGACLLHRRTNRRFLFARFREEPPEAHSTLCRVHLQIRDVTAELRADNLVDTSFFWLQIWLLLWIHRSWCVSVVLISEVAVVFKEWIN